MEGLREGVKGGGCVVTLIFTPTSLQVTSPAHAAGLLLCSRMCAGSAASHASSLRALPRRS